MGRCIYRYSVKIYYPKIHMVQLCQLKEAAYGGDYNKTACNSIKKDCPILRMVNRAEDIRRINDNNKQ